MQTTVQHIAGQTFTTITFMQGETVSIPVSVAVAGVAVNLTGYTLKTTIRTNPPTSLTTDNGGITITNAIAGQFSVNMSDTTTEAIAAGNYAYDLWMISGGGVATPLLSGQVVVTPSITPIP